MDLVVEVRDVITLEQSQLDGVARPVDIALEGLVKRVGEPVSLCCQTFSFSSVGASLAVRRTMGWVG